MNLSNLGDSAFLPLIALKYLVVAKLSELRNMVIPRKCSLNNTLPKLRGNLSRPMRTKRKSRKRKTWITPKEWIARRLVTLRSILASKDNFRKG